jgi:hypothetical protein
MSDNTEISNVTPLRPRDPTAALRARRARRKRKSVTRTVTGTVTEPSIAPSGKPNEINSTVTVLGNPSNHDGMSIAIRDAARSASLVAVPESSHVARLLKLELTSPRIEVSPPPPSCPPPHAWEDDPPVRHHPWTAVGRPLVGLAIVATGAFIAYTSMRANSWFGHSLTPDPAAGDIYATLSVAAEVLACLIPTGIRFYATSGERWTVFFGWALMVVALIVVLLAAGGFAVTNLNAGIEARAERETPAMRDLRVQLAGLDRSIGSECVKRGDRCRELERQRAEANAKLGTERAVTRADADPQAAALGVSSTALHLIQAGAMVALCLFSVPHRALAGPTGHETFATLRPRRRHQRSVIPSFHQLWRWPHLACGGSLMLTATSARRRSCP